MADKPGSAEERAAVRSAIAREPTPEPPPWAGASDLSKARPGREREAARQFAKHHPAMKELELMGELHGIGEGEVKTYYGKGGVRYERPTRQTVTPGHGSRRGWRETLSQVARGSLLMVKGSKAKTTPEQMAAAQRMIELLDRVEADFKSFQSAQPPFPEERVDLDSALRSIYDNAERQLGADSVARALEEAPQPTTDVGPGQEARRLQQETARSKIAEGEALARRAISAADSAAGGDFVWDDEELLRWMSQNPDLLAAEAGAPEGKPSMAQRLRSWLAGLGGEEGAITWGGGRQSERTLLNPWMETGGGRLGTVPTFSELAAHDARLLRGAGPWLPRGSLLPDVQALHPNLPLAQQEAIWARNLHPGLTYQGLPRAVDPHAPRHHLARLIEQQDGLGDDAPHRNYDAWVGGRRRAAATEDIPELMRLWNPSAEAVLTNPYATSTGVPPSRAQIGTLRTVSKADALLAREFEGLLRAAWGAGPLMSDEYGRRGQRFAWHTGTESPPRPPRVEGPKKKRVAGGDEPWQWRGGRGETKWQRPKHGKWGFSGAEYRAARDAQDALRQWVVDNMGFVARYPELIDHLPGVAQLDPWGRPEAGDWDKGPGPAKPGRAYVRAQAARRGYPEFTPTWDLPHETASQLTPAARHRADAREAALYGGMPTEQSLKETPLDELRGWFSRPLGGEEGAALINRRAFLGRLAAGAAAAKGLAGAELPAAAAEAPRPTAAAASSAPYHESHMQESIREGIEELTGRRLLTAPQYTDIYGAAAPPSYMRLPYQGADAITGGYDLTPLEPPPERLALDPPPTQAVRQQAAAALPEPAEAAAPRLINTLTGQPVPDMPGGTPRRVGAPVDVKPPVVLRGENVGDVSKGLLSPANLASEVASGSSALALRRLIAAGLGEGLGAAVAYGLMPDETTPLQHTRGTEDFLAGLMGLPQRSQMPIYSLPPDRMAAVEAAQGMVGFRPAPEVLRARQGDAAYPDWGAAPITAEEVRLFEEDRARRGIPLPENWLGGVQPRREAPREWEEQPVVDVGGGVTWRGKRKRRTKPTIEELGGPYLQTPSRAWAGVLD